MKKPKNTGMLPLLDLPTKKPKRQKPTKSFFDKFDKGTQLKLQVFKDYLTCWLPVFLEQRHIENINIIDLFAGKGQDSEGNPGSPLIALEAIKSFEHRRGGKAYPKVIRLLLNDKEKEYTEKIKQKMKETTLPGNIKKISILTKTFEDALSEYYSIMSSENTANFIFLDPYGLLPNSVVEKISLLPRTDFLIFVPSSYIYRLADTEEFKSKYPGLQQSDFNNLETAHRVFCTYLNSCIAAKEDYFLHAFAIEKTKKSQKHCLIFGSKSFTGLYKFIQNAWKLDPENGESNFRFTGDLSKNGFFKEMTGSTKVRTFQRALRTNILNGTLKTNDDVFRFALTAGFHPPSEHVKKILRDLRTEGKIQVNLRTFALGLKRKSVESIRLMA